MKQHNEFFPNTFQTPRGLIDNNILFELTGSETKLLLVIIRKTYGWFKTQDKISRSQFEELTGLDKKSIQQARNGLIGKKLIEYIPENGMIPSTYILLNDRFEPLKGAKNSPSDDDQGGEKFPLKGAKNSPHKTILNNKEKSNPANPALIDNESEIEIFNNDEKSESLSTPKINIRNRIKELFDNYYQDIYNEKFSWGKNGARYGKEIGLIIANAGDYDDDDVIQRIEAKMSMLRWFCETKPEFWKFNYSMLANRWNEIVIPSDKDIPEFEKLITVWNKLTGQDLKSSPALIHLMSIAKHRNGLSILKKGVVAKALNKFDIDNNSRNLSFFLNDNKGQVSSYAGKYDEQKMSGIVQKKLSQSHDQNSPFPEINEKSDWNYLKNYDWTQFGLDTLSRFVIGDDGYKRIKSGEPVINLIEEILDKKMDEYLKKGLVKNG